MIDPAVEALVAAGRDLTGLQLSRFVPPEQHTGRTSAVLLLFSSAAGPRDDGGEASGGSGEQDRVQILLTRRADGLRKHAGQVAFPGGRAEPGDDSPEATALRETTEETGVDARGVRVLARWPALWIPVSSSAVTPVLGWWETPRSDLAADPAEVAQICQVRLADLADPQNRVRCAHPSGYIGAAFVVGELFVWGFTAGLLDRVLSLGGWARPWNRSRTVQLTDAGEPDWERRRT